MFPSMRTTGVIICLLTMALVVGACGSGDSTDPPRPERLAAGEAEHQGEWDKVYSHAKAEAKEISRNWDSTDEPSGAAQAAGGLGCIAFSHLVEKEAGLKTEGGLGFRIGPGGQAIPEESRLPRWTQDAAIYGYLEGLEEGDLPEQFLQTTVRVINKGSCGGLTAPDNEPVQLAD